MGKNKAVFLDRDGVINEDYGYVHKIEDFHIFDEVYPALKKLRERGFKLLIITNQSGIGMGYYTEEDFFKITEHMKEKLKEKGIEIDKVYYCPHHPEGVVPEYTMKCNCRKPETGMIEEGIKDFDIDISQSFLIGDKETDIEAGKKVGLKTILVKTGRGKKYMENTKADYIAENILDAVDNFILKEDKNSSD
jgi:D-glycero-D-manno-heptose 1,7-bisphosphate phosphatase